jgi:DNA-binding CsgD family transcriptional regulator
VADRDLSGLFRDLIEGDPERGVVILGADRRVVYANGAARAHLRDGSPRGGDPLLPASVQPWIEEFAARSPGQRFPTSAEAWYPSDTDRRLRLTLDSISREATAVLVLRSSPAQAWPEPTVKRLQGRFGLTLREAQVAAGVARGLTNLEVANRLGIVEKTVKNVLMSVFTKCRVRNRVELALRAFEAPLPAPEPARSPSAEV